MKIPKYLEQMLGKFYTHTKTGNVYHIKNIALGQDSNSEIENTISIIYEIQTMGLRNKLTENHEFRVFCRSYDDFVLEIEGVERFTPYV